MGNLGTWERHPLMKPGISTAGKGGKRVRANLGSWVLEDGKMSETRCPEKSRQCPSTASVLSKISPVTTGRYEVHTPSCMKLYET